MRNGRPISFRFQKIVGVGLNEKLLFEHRFRGGEWLLIMDFQKEYVLSRGTSESSDP